MSAGKAAGPIEILMVEDSIDDIQITLEAFKDAKVRSNLNAVRERAGDGLPAPTG